MRRPIVGISLVFSVGVLCGLQWDNLLQAALVLSVCFWFIAWFAWWRTRNVLASLGLMGVLFSLGVAVSQRQVSDASRTSSLGDVCFDQGTVFCRLEGIVDQDVIDTVRGKGPRYIRFNMLVDTVVVGRESHLVSLPVRMTLYGDGSREPVYGERWVMSGSLLRLHNNPLEQPPVWFFRTHVSRASLMASARPSLMVRAQALRRSAAATLAQGVGAHAEEVGVLHAMLLGYRSQLPESIRNSFSRTGTMHIFAISGLHVAMMTSILVFIIHAFSVQRHRQIVVLAPLIVLYAIGTGHRASALRAGSMACAYFLAPALGRRPDAVSSIALAALAILIWQPESLTELGFLFSFSVVTGILVMVPVFDVWMTRKLQSLSGHALRWTSMQPPLWYHALLWLGRLLSVSLAAWLTSAPLTLYFFERWSPVAILANLWVMPMAFLIVLTGCLSLFSAVIFGTTVVHVFNHANVVFVRMLAGGMRGFEKMPFGSMEGHGLSLTGVMLWYGFLVVVVAILRSRQRAETECAPYACS